MSARRAGGWHETVGSRARWLARGFRARWIRLLLTTALLAALAAGIFWLLTPVTDQPAPGEVARVDLPASVASEIETQLGTLTPAELARIGELGFVSQPYPEPPPPQAVPMAPSDGDAAAQRNFEDFRFAYSQSGCDHGRPENEDRFNRARSALQAMDQQLEGVAEARLRYHQGLVALCESDFAAAAQNFAAARESARATRGAVARQYAAVANVGAWLAGRRNDVAATAPLRPDQGAFTGQLCRPPVREDCDLFDNRSNQLLRAALSGLASGRARDPDTYNWLKRELGTDAGALGPQTVANLAAAAAVHGDTNYIGALMRAARRQLNAPQATSAAGWVNSPAAARLVNLAWIAGRLRSDDPSLSQWFPTAAELPVNVGFEPEDGRTNSDIVMMSVWHEVGRDRSLLREANFEEFTARANAPSNAPPAEREFLQDVRSQMLRGAAPMLSEYADALRGQPGGTAQRDTLLRLLRTKAFSRATRLDAAARQEFGVSIWILGVILLILFLLGAVFVSVFGSVLAGYARAFPRRHFDDRAANLPAQASASPAPPS